MLSFRKLENILNSQRGLKSYLRDNGINPTQLNKSLKTGDFGSKTLDKLCFLLQCQPGDILEYIPDEENSDST